MIIVHEDFSHSNPQKMIDEISAWRMHANRTRARERLYVAGEWMVEKWRDQAHRLGVFRAASNMRKQGIPFEVALATLQPGAEVRS